MPFIDMGKQLGVWVMSQLQEIYSDYTRRVKRILPQE
jgi:hypothetical protein